MSKILNFKFLILKISQLEGGFTLLETVIASAVALIAGTFLVAILVNHNGVFYQQNSVVSEGLSLNDAIREIDNNIRLGVSVAVGYPEDVPEIYSDNDSLVIKIPAINGVNVTPNVYDFIVISKDQSNIKVLKIQIFPDPQSTRPASNRVLTTLLESVSFTYLDKNGEVVAAASSASVKVDLTVLSKTGSVGSSRSSSSTTTLRNFNQ